MKRPNPRRRLGGIIRLLPILLTACTHRPNKLNVLYVARPLVTDSVRMRRTEADAARLLGGPLLNTVMLPRDTREVRLSAGYSMIAGEPTPVLRLIQNQQEVTGELWRIWIKRQGHGARVPSTRCTVWTDSLRTCGTQVFIPPSDWRVISDSMAGLQVWTIDARCESDGAFWADAGDLYITRLQGSVFSRYGCNAPSRRSTSDAGRAAARLSEYFARVVRQLTSKGAS